MFSKISQPAPLVNSRVPGFRLLDVFIKSTRAVFRIKRGVSKKKQLSRIKVPPDLEALDDLLIDLS